MEEMFMMI